MCGFAERRGAVVAVMGRERRRPEREDGGGAYGPWVAGPWERVLTGMVVVVVVM